jgi:antitoxin component YwqK of YwqJK toxin-antitoxin module
MKKFSKITKFFDSYGTIGTLKEYIPLANKKTHGLVRQYYGSGILLRKTLYKNGIIHGIRKVYNETGSLQFVIPFANGKQHGTAICYYESGALEREDPYINDKEHGAEIWYFESGMVDYIAVYKNGSIAGPCTDKYRKDGTRQAYKGRKICI